MDARTFFTQGEEVEIRRVDERGDSLFAFVAAVRGGKVALSWRGGKLPAGAPQPGGLVRLIRTDDRGRQFAVKVHVAKVQPEHAIVIPRSKPMSYDRREYLRAEAPLALRCRVVDGEEARRIRKEIEARGSATVTRARTLRARTSTLPGMRVPGGGRTLSPMPETGQPALPLDAQRQLDRIEEKLDRVMEHLGITSGAKALGPRKVVEVSISGSGIRFRSKWKAETDDLMEVDVELPLAPPVSIRSLVKVLRCRRADGPSSEGDWIVAGTFDTIHEDDQASVVRYTFDHQRELQRSESGAQKAG